MTRHKHRPPSQRQLRVGEIVRHALAELIERGELHDPDLDGVPVTVTQVAMSPDLRNGTAYVMPLGGVEAARTVAALNRAAPFLQGRVARAVRLKFAPRLRFASDESFDYADKITRLLHGAGGGARDEQDNGAEDETGDEDRDGAPDGGGDGSAA
ncbi:MAG: 30S ribosome-binding factor RbfA [Rhodospirillaceae bacterium]|jgi:ribosome-binding factor A|nr:30S ribosome-binding factor RbfA [Rhodospirillaceae bacterium]MBT5415372.1 30S ribosome-binding factor RbfA [Rhodospirillaceae bacterium]MBT6118602.1 30S ribosome-binding factor RbfA [Rhodospirillaceae bacterium]